jgi:hypothetical protein
VSCVVSPCSPPTGSKKYFYCGLKRVCNTKKLPQTVGRTVVATQTKDDDQNPILQAGSRAGRVLVRTELVVLRQLQSLLCDIDWY